MAAVIVAGLAFAAGWTPPAKTAHRFTAASDYRPARESGCTNSGEGCHGSEKEYVDFLSYHPDTECTVCHEYDGVGCIPCHEPQQHECTGCHDGTMEGAADTVRLRDPYPRGHYRETSHTAMGTDMSQEVRAADGGRASAACRDCHSRDLRTAHLGVPVVAGSPYGPEIGCGECHNDVRSGGLAVVRDEWPERRCDDCHELDSSSPAHAYDVAPPAEARGGPGCGATGQGCHEVADLHALHPDEPRTCSGSAKRGEPGCHDPDAQSHVPTATGCGIGSRSCHPAYLPATYSHERDREDHSPSSGGPAGRTSYHGVACGACHHMAPDGTSLVVEHSLPTSQRSRVPDNVCRDCHNHPASAPVLGNEWAARDGDASCYVCHDGRGLGTAHPLKLSPIHTVFSGSRGCAASGPGCHPTADLSAVGAAGDGALHRTCLRCHDRTGGGSNLSYDPSRKTCGSGRDCHAAPGRYQPSTGIHDGAGGRADGADAAHHDAGGAQGGSAMSDSASGVTESCASCHDTLLGVEHSRPGNRLAAGDVCTGCHNAADATVRAVKTDWPERGTAAACGSCHDAGALHGDFGALHQATQYDYRGVASGTGCARAGCHPSADVRILHRRLGCTPSGCHQREGDILGRGIMSCGGGGGLSGSSCHAGDDRHAGADDPHQATERDQYGNPEPGSCATAGCHGTVDVRDLHTTDFCYTAGCHVAGGPTLMSCGGLDGQQSCHTTSARHRSLEASHQAGEYNRFGLPEAGSCEGAGCHATVDVRTLHTTNQCATAGCHVVGGPTLMTCGGLDGQANCHTDSTRHRTMDASHQAVELGTTGLAQPGACTRAGCHTTADVRTLHTTNQCATAGCHVVGGPTLMTCGGTAASLSCHNPPPPATCFVLAPPAPAMRPHSREPTGSPAPAAAEAGDGAGEPSGEASAAATDPSESEGDTPTVEATSTPDEPPSGGGEPPSSEAGSRSTPEPAIAGRRHPAREAGPADACPDVRAEEPHERLRPACLDCHGVRGTKPK